MEIRERMEVVSSDGYMVGILDHIRMEGHLQLTKEDGVHHLIPDLWVAKVDDKIHLLKTRDQVHAGWVVDPPN